MRNLRALAILIGSAFSPQIAAAQPAEAPVTGQAASPPETVAPVDCGPKAAVYQAGKSTRIWVMRQGTMVLAENPLRPMSRDEVVVLDVVVNGRRATAWGLDLDNLRQGGSPKSVEREGREPIHWKEASVAPAGIRVVADDGRVLLGPIAFAGCEDAPAAKPVADKPVQAERPAKGGRKPKAAAAEPTSPLPSHLPQGAIDGLSLPKGQR